MVIYVQGTAVIRAEPGAILNFHGITKPPEVKKEWNKAEFGISNDNSYCTLPNSNR